MAHGNELCPTWMSHVADTGWLRLVGSLQWWVSFAKEPYKRDHILQKRPIILRSLLIVATPDLDGSWLCRVYTNESCFVWISMVFDEWVQSHGNQSRHSAMTRDFVFGTQISRASYEWVMSRINESCLVWVSHAPCWWVTSQCHGLWLCLSYTNKSCIVWMSHVPYKWVESHGNQSRHSAMACDFVFGIQISHVSYKWVTSRINESRLT